MKNSKKLVVLFLILVLGITSFVPATFSWYDHSGALTGGIMRYSKTGLPVSAGAVTVETKQFRTENNRLFYDEKGNKQYQGSAITSFTLVSGVTQFFGTTFTNTGAAPAYVNLYLHDFSNDPKNFIGTLAPSLTYRGISSAVHLTNKNSVRVYFQFSKANGWNDENAKRYVVYKASDGNAYRELTTAITKGESGSQLLADQKALLTEENIEKTYYVDLPNGTTEFYFATDANKSAFNTTTFAVTQPWYRTRSITNVQPEVCYYLTGSSDDTTWNAQYASFAIPGGVSVMSYFDTATMSPGQHAYVTLNEGTHYTGASATYAVQSGSVAVNGNTGFVTAGDGLGHGNSATIRTTITGVLGDTKTIDTTISNPSAVNAPVALNVKVPGATTKTVDGQTVTTNGTAEIVWYVTNGSSSDCSFSSIYYTE